MMKKIALSNRFKVTLFSNIIPYNKRCDIQSQCGQSAQKLLNVLHTFHSQNANSDLYCESEEAIEVRRRVMRILDLSSDIDGTDETYHNVGHTNKCINKDLDQKYLSQYKCNTFALMILEEAILQFEEFKCYGSQGRGMTFINNQILNSLETLINEMKSSEYKSQIGIDFIDERIQLFKLKFRGNGVEYLKQLYKK
jgi:hypothetical protein